MKLLLIRGEDTVPRPTLDDPNHLAVVDIDACDVANHCKKLLETAPRFSLPLSDALTGLCRSCLCNRIV